MVILILRFFYEHFVLAHGVSTPQNTTQLSAAFFAEQTNEELSALETSFLLLWSALFCAFPVLAESCSLAVLLIPFILRTRLVHENLLHPARLRLLTAVYFSFWAYFSSEESRPLECFALWLPCTHTILAAYGQLSCVHELPLAMALLFPQVGPRVLFSVSLGAASLHWFESWPLRLWAGCVIVCSAGYSNECEFAYCVYCSAFAYWVVGVRRLTSYRAPDI